MARPRDPAQDPGSRPDRLQPEGGGPQQADAGPPAPAAPVEPVAPVQRAPSIAPPDQQPLPEPPEFDGIGPYTEAFALGGRDFVPVNEWQVADEEVADIGSWGMDEPPEYTADLPAAQRRAAEERIRAQQEKVGQTGGGQAGNA